MASLSTIYGASAAIGTVAAFLAAYLGHTIYPIQTGGSIASVIESVTEKVKEVTEDIAKPVEQPLNTEVTPLEPPVEEQPLPQVELPPVLEEPTPLAEEPVVEQPTA
jgi:NADPH:quinone reductase-like Zn-dependent oxidoreductase